MSPWKRKTGDALIALTVGILLAAAFLRLVSTAKKEPEPAPCCSQVGSIGNSGTINNYNRLPDISQKIITAALIAGTRELDKRTK